MKIKSVVHTYTPIFVKSHSTWVFTKAFYE